MKKKLKITIEVGNAQMETPVQIAAAVKGVSDKIVRGDTEGYIIDLNGNTVGSWEIAKEAS